MRKFLAVFLLAGALVAGLVPASSAQAPTVAASAQWTLTGWKLGGLPDGATLCVANGIGASYNYEYVIEQINNSSWGPNITVRNTCTGYSITNRMTIDSYADGTTTCAKFTNTHRTYDSVQGKSVWDQNVVLWYNLSDYCVGEDTVRAHRTAMYIEYVLGLSYDPGANTPLRVICSTSWCMYNVKYVQYEDRRRLGYIYGLEA